MELVSTSGEFWLLVVLSHGDDRHRGFSLWCSAERILRGWVVSPAALQFLLSHRFVSE